MSASAHDRAPRVDRTPDSAPAIVLSFRSLLVPQLASAASASVWAQSAIHSTLFWAIRIPVLHGFVLVRFLSLVRCACQADKNDLLVDLYYY